MRKTLHVSLLNVTMTIMLELIQEFLSNSSCPPSLPWLSWSMIRLPRTTARTDKIGEDMQEYQPIFQEEWCMPCYLKISSSQSLFYYPLLRIIYFVIIPRIALWFVVVSLKDYFPNLVRGKKQQLARSAVLRNWSDTGFFPRRPGHGCLMETRRSWSSKPQVRATKWPPSTAHKM